MESIETIFIFRKHRPFNQSLNSNLHSKSCLLYIVIGPIHEKYENEITKSDENRLKI